MYCQSGIITKYILMGFIKPLSREVVCYSDKILYKVYYLSQWEAD